MKLPHKMTLRSKITWLVSINIFFILLMVLSAASNTVINKIFKETGERALLVSRTVAGMPQVVDAFSQRNPSRIIQPIAEDMRKRTGAEFIVISNMDLIRYSHPTPSEIGKHMVGEDNDAVLKGLDSITESKGTLGYSIRGKAPIFDRSHRQIGVISTGFLVQNIWGDLKRVLLRIMAIGLVALVFGSWGAYILAGHVKKQILNMEPNEIAFATQEQAAILDAIREGIIAVNSKGKIVTCNREARKLLSMEEGDLIGKDIASVFPSTRLLEVLKDGTPQYDQPALIGNTLAIANRVPVMLSNNVIGAVATFRDKMKLDQIDRRLADIGQYVDTLRSQRHEFMNKLHLISGLIQMSEYDKAKEVIEIVNEEHQEAMDFYLARIRDAAIVGILVGKTHRAKELGIELSISSESYVSECCPNRDVVVSILGNTIENAFDAIRTSDCKKNNPFVTVFIKEAKDALHINVRDNGPGICPDLKERIFEQGVSTKGEGRGFGLSLISRLISNIGGDISCDSSSEGTVINVNLPIERSC